MSALPRISVITPSFNQGAYLEKTIRSVLDQNYPNLEYMILDGGSTDGSVEVIKRYADRLAYWTSAPDAGQSAAVNNGIRRATGEIVAYVNSDDWLCPDALRIAAEVLGKAEPGSHEGQWLCGVCEQYLPDGSRGRVFRPTVEKVARLAADRGRCVGIPVMPFMQPACFWRRGLFEAVGFFREDMQNGFDTEHAVRTMFAGYLPSVVGEVVAGALIHGEGKCVKAMASGCTDTDKFFSLHAPELTPRELRRARFLMAMRAVGKSRDPQESRLAAPFRILASGAPFRYPVQFLRGAWHKAAGREWSGEEYETWE
jgi:glycosyltransferase involved in cell wall biosynthesis